MFILKQNASPERKGREMLIPCFPIFTEESVGLELLQLFVLWFWKKMGNCANLGHLYTEQTSAQRFTCHSDSSRSEMPLLRAHSQEWGDSARQLKTFIVYLKG